MSEDTPQDRAENRSTGNSLGLGYMYKIMVARGVLGRMNGLFSDTRGTDILLLKDRKFRSREPSMKCKGPRQDRVKGLGKETTVYVCVR